MAEFVDEAQLHARAGDGGAGAVSFRREAHVAKGGPDGGDGGDGGNVWVVADSSVSTLLEFTDHPFRRATNGVHGQGKTRHGARGKDITVRLPVGTVLKDLEGNVLVDLARPGDRWLAARGGQGGKGNARFLSNQRRAPGFAEQGEHGEERWYDLEIKLVADVALVGFPNAGKSTLISRISAAKPRIADYPFTTLVPNLGVVRHRGVDFVVADVPGLIEGAAEGKGLGHRFLRHVERARALVVLADLASWERSPAEQEEVLLDELRRYQPDLLERPRIVIGSRVDLARSLVEAGQLEDHGFEGHAVSSHTGEGIDRVLDELARMVSQAREAEPDPAGFVIHRPIAEGVRVERDFDGAWVVRGRPAERAVALNNLTDPSALAFAQHRLQQLGVPKALAKAGAKQGEIVRIAKFEFEYEPDD